MRKIERNKMVKHEGILIDSRADGGVHIQLVGETHSPGGSLDLSEIQALRLYELLGDMTDWVDHDGDDG
jgi:hypothetical protein